MRYLLNILIALDQLANTMLGGRPGETITDRMARAIAEGRCKLCRVVCKALDVVDPGHCPVGAFGAKPVVASGAVEPDMDLTAKVLELCNQNTAAATLIARAWNFAIVYDNMIDGDKRSSDAEVHDAMDFALNIDPFMAKHPSLVLVFKTALEQWRAANDMEREGKNLEAAYVLRCAPYVFYAAVVLQAAGPEKAREATRFFYSHNPDDSLEKYMKEHATC